MKEIIKIPLFATPVYKATIDPLSYKKENIVKTILNNFKKVKYRNNWDDNNISSSYLHHPLDDFNNKKFKLPDFSSVIPLYKTFFETAFQDLKFKEGIEKKFNYQIVNYTVCDEDNFMRRHNHMRSDFSCIHYIYFEPHHSCTMFYHPGDYLMLHLKDVRKSFYDKLNKNLLENSCYHQNFQINVKEDDIVMFPGYLHHEIPKSKNKYKKPRITVVLNIDFND